MTGRKAATMNNQVKVKENAFIDEKYYYIKHRSGLDIYVFPKNLSTSYALFGTRYGSIDNKFKLRGEEEYTSVPDGIAHFLEHKMFENENGEDTFLRYAKTGASANAYTSFNMTAYLFSCTANFYDSLEILLDFVTAPYFTPETVQKEQGIIAQEIRMGEDNPGNRMIFDLLKAMYAEHAVRTEIAGTVESISHITADVLYKCYNAFYNLHNMSLIVCGDVNVDDTLAIADKYLKEQPDFDVQSVYAKEKPEVAKKFTSRKMQVAKPLFSIGVKNIDIPTEPWERSKLSAATGILNDMLFGRASDFFNSLYTEGLISKSFGYWSETCKSFSLIDISGDSKEPKKVYDRFIEYITEKKANGLDAEDFERCFRVAYTGFIKSFDSTDGIANNFLNFIFDDMDMLDYVDVLNSVTFEDVSAAFEKLYKEEYICMAVIYPIEETSDGEK